jgi:hypothetical protein
MRSLSDPQTNCARRSAEDAADQRELLDAEARRAAAAVGRGWLIGGEDRGEARDDAERGHRTAASPEWRSAHLPFVHNTRERGACTERGAHERAGPGPQDRDNQDAAGDCAWPRRGRQVRPCWQLAMRSGRQRSESGRSLRISPARGTATADLSSWAVALAETLREPKIKSRIEAMQITLQIGGPDVQRKFLADQMKLWGPVVKEHNIKTDS